MGLVRFIGLGQFWSEVSGEGVWRCGCDSCEYRADFTTRDHAEEAARLHNNKEHGGHYGLPTTFFDRLFWPYAQVYTPSWWRRFGDYSMDHE